MSIAYLKVKIKSLAAEATIIHKDERKFNIGARGRTRLKRMLRRNNDLTPGQRARIERRLTAHNQPDAMETFWGLRRHRTEDVRSESRAALLAYGYLRGLSYKQVEASTKTEAHWPTVQRLVEKYGVKGNPIDLDAWREPEIEA